MSIRLITIKVVGKLKEATFLGSLSLTVSGGITTPGGKTARISGRVRKALTGFPTEFRIILSSLMSRFSNAGFCAMRRREERAEMETEKSSRRRVVRWVVVDINLGKGHHY